MTDDPFVSHRGLFTVAYEMLGSAVDAEDVVQETWLRWADVDQAEVRDARAYLVRMVTRQARFEIGGEVTAVSLVIEDDRITRIYAMRNPNKLGGLEQVAQLQR